MPVHWVVVNSDGTVRRSSGGITVNRTATGQFVITWPTATSGCSLAATLSTDSASTGSLNSGEVQAFGPEGTSLTANQSEVATRDDVGAFADHGFNAQQVC